MKKIIMMMFIITLTSCATKHNIVHHSNGYIPLIRFKGDTIAYMRENFVKHKDRYIGKSLNVLLADLEIPIKSYSPATGGNKFKGVQLSEYERYTALTKIDELKNPRIIAVEWLNPVPDSAALQLITQDHDQWSKEAVNLMGGYIIKSLNVDDFLKKRDSSLY